MTFLTFNYGTKMTIPNNNYGIKWLLLTISYDLNDYFWLFWQSGLVNYSGNTHKKWQLLFKGLEITYADSK